MTTVTIPIDVAKRLEVWAWEKVSDVNPDDKTRTLIESHPDAETWRTLINAICDAATRPKRGGLRCPGAAGGDDGGEG